MKIRILGDVKTDLTEEEILSMLPEDIDPIGISEIKVKNCLVRYFLYKNEIVITEVNREGRIMEIWKDIKGYEGKYQVSNLGNVKSLNYNSTGK